MNLDLCTIDWTAIGSIATVIAMIIAYRTIYISVKQNKDNQKFQTLLVQREIEQKRLDELVDNIMIINDSIQPIVVADYSVKLTKGIFTEDDRHFIDEMAANDISNNNRLSVQLIKYDRNESAKKVLMILSNMRQKYIIRKSKFPQNPKRSVRFSGKRTKRSVQKRKARNTQKAETKVL